MRELTMAEVDCVAGAYGECTVDDVGGNNFGGMTDLDTGSTLEPVYEYLVSIATDLFEALAD